MVAALYFALWGLTWIFGPTAVKRRFVEHWAAKHDAQGKAVFAEIVEDARFSGSGFNFWPDPIPQGYPWACVGRPVVPAPFLVYTDYAYLRGGLDGGAARVYFIWTPWKVYGIDKDVHWSA